MIDLLVEMKIDVRINELMVFALADQLAKAGLVDRDELAATLRSHTAAIQDLPAEQLSSGQVLLREKISVLSTALAEGKSPLPLNPPAKG